MAPKTKAKPEVTNVDEYLEKKYASNVHKANTLPKLYRVPTGIAAIDIALGGGMPLGRSVHISGLQSGGKTTLALHTVKAFQRAGFDALYNDHERTLMPLQADKIGVDTERLEVGHPIGGEESLEMALDHLQKETFKLAIIDSVPGLTPKSILDATEEDYTKQSYAAIASFLNRMQDTIIRSVETSGGMLLFINQVRSKISSMPVAGKNYPGGNALKFMTSIHIDIKWSKSEAETPGYITSYFEVEKNKTFGTQGFEGEFNINKGVIDVYESLVRYAEKAGLIRKSGAWLYIENGIPESLGRVDFKAQGTKNLARELEEYPEVFDLLYKQVLVANDIDLDFLIFPEA